MELYGKYRAEVFDIRDPRKMGRVRLKIPSLLNEGVSAWAIPCIPLASDFEGLEIGDTVWVEFEEGHLDKPIIVGTWWAERETPIKELNNSYENELKRRRIKTKKGNIIDLVDKDGEEVIEIKDFKGNLIKISCTDDTIEIKSNSKINISAENISLNGEVEISKNLKINGDINATGSIIDTAGNTNNHTH